MTSPIGIPTIDVTLAFTLTPVGMAYVKRQRSSVAARLEAAAWIFGGPGFDAEYPENITKIGELLIEAEHHDQVAECLRVWAVRPQLMESWAELVKHAPGTPGVQLADQITYRLYWDAVEPDGTQCLMPRPVVAVDALRDTHEPGTLGMHEDWPATKYPMRVP